MTAESWSALASAVGVVVAIVALIAESRRSRFAQSLSILSQLDSRFESPEFRQARRVAAVYLRAPDPSDLVGEEAVHTVLNFFETVGFLFRKGVVDAESIWHYFATWILPYYTASGRFLTREQLEDPNCYRELKPLYAAVFQVEERERNYQAATSVVSPEAIARFLESEAVLPREAKP